MMWLLFFSFVVVVLIFIIGPWLKQFKNDSNVV